MRCVTASQVSYAATLAWFVSKPRVVLKLGSASRLLSASRRRYSLALK
jgi:hypothetical protein